MMDAKTAKRIAEEALRSTATETFLEEALKKIEEAANSGRFSTVDPVSASNSELVEATYKRLEKLDYKVKLHRNPDTSDPREHDYYEVSWS